MLILRYIKVLIKANYLKRKKIHLVSPYASESRPNPGQKREERNNLTSSQLSTVWAPKNSFVIQFLFEISNFHQLKLL